jgi:3-methyladenine DNA glycosylase AlkC
MAGLNKENPLKNVFNEKTVTDLANRIKSVFEDFDTENFIKENVLFFPQLAFLERSKHLREKLRTFLPDDYAVAINILLKALGPELDPEDVAALDGFVVMAQCDFVSEYGKNHFDLSFKALYEMTKRFSAEGYVRTFIEIDYEKSMKILHDWCKDPNPHVRRLVSEGTRPRLPLAGRIKRFQKNPQPVIELLEKLKDDTSLYVRRSVANNINDIAKDNPEIAISTLKRWHSIDNKNVLWVVRHASRYLLKKGNIEVLKFLGYNPDVKIELNQFKIDNTLYKIGAEMKIAFSLTIHEIKKSKVMIDYIIGFVKANGKIAEKVFKMRDCNLAKEENVEVLKSHKFKDTSGRKHYPGEHYILLQINGIRFHKISFNIEKIKDSLK